MQQLTQWLGSAPPSADAEQAVAIARDHFGVVAQAKPLYAERDRNFQMQSADGQTWLLKIAHQDASVPSVLFQNRVLRFLERQCAPLPTPRVLSNLEGQDHFTWTSPAGQQHQVRALSWLPGESLALAQAEPAVREWLGKDLAKLGLALTDCPVEGAPKTLPWDLCNTSSLWPLVDALTNAELRAMATRTLTQFDQHWSAAIKRLGHQLIHNDTNPDNVLFDQAQPRRVSGFIDFGDMVCAPLICDLAVACAYQVQPRGKDPLADLIPMARGYCAVSPLSPQELELLPGLVSCRLAQTLLIQGWRAQHDPGGNSEDLANDCLEAGRRLLRFKGLDATGASERLARACAAV